jgi:hypothetical protein
MTDSTQKLRVGTSIVSHLSDAFYEDAARVFEEYVTNASDALATHVRIRVDPTIVMIEDDGEGMSPDELHRFFYISYSSKKTGEIRDMFVGKNKKAIKRQIIGQFGIGKLSAYKFADKISIKTWKDGVVSSASLSFKELMDKEFVEDLSLSVTSEKSNSTKHGTLVEMSGLKQQVYSKVIIKRLSQRLTLHPDLNIDVNGQQLEPELLRGKKISIDEEHPKLGHIVGTLIYTDDPHYEEAGVHIRVYGRTVNLNPRLISSVMNVSGALVLAQRAILDINIDSLAPAILAHRNGFNEDHPLVKDLEKWIKTKLNYENARYLRDRRGDSDKLQEAKVIVTLADRLSGSKRAIQESSKGSQLRSGRKRIRDRVAALKEADNIIAQKSTLELEFKHKKFIFDLAPMGEDAAAWAFEEKKRTIQINSDHPLFKEAKNRKSQDLYALTTGIVAIAFHTSSSHAEFKANYEELARIASKK